MVVVGGATVVTGVVARVVDGARVDAVAGATGVVATTDVVGDEVSPESPVQAATRAATVSAARATLTFRVRAKGLAALR